MKKFIGWTIIILSALASVFAGVMQIVLSYQLFGVFVEAFIPHWSCWFFFGIITAFLGVLLLMEEKK